VAVAVMVVATVAVARAEKSNCLNRCCCYNI